MSPVSPPSPSAVPSTITTTTDIARTSTNNPYLHPRPLRPPPEATPFYPSTVDIPNPQFPSSSSTASTITSFSGRLLHHVLIPSPQSNRNQQSSPPRPLPDRHLSPLPHLLSVPRRSPLRPSQPVVFSSRHRRHHQPSQDPSPNPHRHPPTDPFPDPKSAAPGTLLPIHLHET